MTRPRDQQSRKERDGTRRRTQLRQYPAFRQRPGTLRCRLSARGPSRCHGGEPACPPGDSPKSWERQPPSRVAWASTPWDGRQPESPGHSGCVARAGARKVRDEDGARPSCRCRPQRPHPTMAPPGEKASRSLGPLVWLRPGPSPVLCPLPCPHPFAHLPTPGGSAGVILRLWGCPTGRGSEGAGAACCVRSRVPGTWLWPRHGAHPARHAPALRSEMLRPEPACSRLGRGGRSGVSCREQTADPVTGPRFGVRTRWALGTITLDSIPGSFTNSQSAHSSV